ncbi:nuclear transcription factor Y subunit A-3-like [Tasmannia lanceolata]|uniref:nuclear transcription factor Y subunit A-3-like n=1 Tax=Tasmannia lanceolata TaxID=3420 RepID=UPI0040631B66
MHNISNKESTHSSVHSTVPSIASYAPWWNSTGSQIPQSSLSKPLTLNLDSPTHHSHHIEQLGIQLQGQGSSSIRSAGQSHNEVACMGTENPQGHRISAQSGMGTGNPQGAQSGYDETNGRRAEGRMKSVLSVENLDIAVPPSQADYNQSIARIAYPYPDPFFGGVLAPYGPPQAIMNPQMLGAPARVPLPLELSEDEPIYVNAKQYSGIIRRRQTRAKLEAQNKLIKARKPYLHESRHLHAMKRQRGNGGRFLNMKLQQSRVTATPEGQNILDSVPLQLGSVSESEPLQLENGNACASATPRSEVTMGESRTGALRSLCKEVALCRTGRNTEFPSSSER